MHAAQGASSVRKQASSPSRTSFRRLLSVSHWFEIEGVFRWTRQPPVLQSQEAFLKVLPREKCCGDRDRRTDYETYRQNRKTIRNMCIVIGKEFEDPVIHKIECQHVYQIKPIADPPEPLQQWSVHDPFKVTGAY